MTAPYVPPGDRKKVKRKLRRINAALKGTDYTGRKAIRKGLVKRKRELEAQLRSGTQPAEGESAQDRMRRRQQMLSELAGS